MRTDPIQHEIAQEKAEGLGRTEKRFLAALAAYRRDQARGDTDRIGVARTERVMRELVESLTSFVVHREACGLRDPRYVFDLYGVPPEVVAGIGVCRPRA
jgi:hypothetical protein